MWIDPKQSVDVRMEQRLTETGQLTGKSTELPDSTDMLEMYRWMVFSRLFDERAIRLQRQGRLGTYAPFSGQEAAQVGSAYALERQDWVFPSYRELPVVWVRGLPFQQSLLYTMGAVEGGKIPAEVNSFPVQIIIAAQALHAMGSAWASQYLHDNAVSVCYVGDGATSQGDFHEALNFASVFHLPVVFFIQNNQWAISVPRSKQANSRSLAQKAIAYDIPGVQVDGNDVLAVYEVTRAAAAKARRGEGPVLIEAVTYRQGPHTTSDDPTRYRGEEEVKAWADRDPIVRMRRFLKDQALLTDDQDEQIRRESEHIIGEAVTAAEAKHRGTLAEAFDAVYETQSRELLRQRAEAATFAAVADSAGSAGSNGSAGHAASAGAAGPAGSNRSAGPSGSMASDGTSRARERGE